MGMGFQNCEVGFGKKMNWEMGLVTPLQDPHSKLGSQRTHLYNENQTSSQKIKTQFLSSTYFINKIFTANNCYISTSPVLSILI